MSRFLGQRELVSLLGASLPGSGELGGALGVTGVSPATVPEGTAAGPR